METQTRVCRHCQRRRPKDQFYRNDQLSKPNSEPYRPECKVCTKARRLYLECQAEAKKGRKRA